MSLFATKTPLVNIGGVMCYHVSENNITDLMKHYSGIESMHRICAYAMQGNLLFGGNNYYNVIDDYLYLYHYNNDRLSFVTIPFNKDGKFMRLSETLEYMRLHNIYRIRCVLDTDFTDFTNNVNVLKKYFDVKHECNEYFYDNRAVAELNGKEFSKMRNKLNKFERSYPNVHFRWGNKDDTLVLQSLYKKWQTEWNGLKYASIFDGRYFETMLKLGNQFFLIFFDGDKSIGFLGYYPSNDYNVHCGFRKLDINYQYLTQYAQVKFCSELFKLGYKYTNDDNDNSSKGLKELKSSFHPIHIMGEYQLIMKK